jgi:arylsulfatase A-like enzyme
LRTALPANTCPIDWPRKPRSLSNRTEPGRSSPIWPFTPCNTPLVGRPDLIEKYQQKAERLGLGDQEQFAGEEQVWPVQDKRQVRILQAHATYAAMVEAMDRAVGKVLDKLEELALDDRTAVFLMSDNGGLSTSEGSPTSNLPLRAGKGWLYEGGIREPFLIRWPGVTKPGSVCRVPVVSSDFYPTILEMAGLALRPDRRLDGVSLVPWRRATRSRRPVLALSALLEPGRFPGRGHSHGRLETDRTL